MSDDANSILSGVRSIFRPYETRRIVIGVGVQFHESELTREPSEFQYLEEHIGSDFRVQSNRNEAEFVNYDQEVRYQLEIVHRKSEFKAALESTDPIVIYAGHSRYGRGACFDQYGGSVTEHGDHWEHGADIDEGMYRLGYPLISIPLEDIEHHQYQFAPIPGEDAPPSRSSRHPRQYHPGVRGRLRRIELTADLHNLVLPAHRSPSHKYWGVNRGRRGTHLLLRAGWETTLNTPMDLGATNIRCKTFCHFGCSSKLHFWRIVRKHPYKAWYRSAPRNERLAYFTTASADHRSIYWVRHLLTNSRPNGTDHMWHTHEDARRRANAQLAQDDRRGNYAGFRIF
jgi:hypothetical protein